MRHGLVLLLAVLAAAPAAHAQDLNYQTFVVGERALGMGGAFTGVADDPSAAYYNPAGLAHLRSGALSGSLSVNAYDSYVIDDAYATPLGARDFSHDGSPTVPLFVGIVKKFGRRDEERVRRFAFALSTFHPTAVGRSFEATIREPIPGDPMMSVVESSIRVTQDDRVTYYGPSFAWRIRPDLAVGVSGFLATRSATHEEHQTIVTLGARDADGFFRNDTLDIEDRIFELDATSLVFRAGVLWDPIERLRLGLTVQVQGVPLSASARVMQRISHADLLAIPAIATYYRSDQGGLDAESPIPWELRVGASYAFSDVSTLALDVSAYTGIGSEEDPVRASGQPDPEPGTMYPPEPGYFVAREWWSELTANASIGFDTLLFGVVPFRVGAYTNLSAAPPIDGPSYAYRPAHLDLFGVTSAVGIRSGGYDIAIGAALLMGSGTAYGYSTAPSADAGPYVPRDLEARTIYFFLSGAKQAAGRLARDVYDEVVE